MSSSEKEKLFTRAITSLRPIKSESEIHVQIDIDMSLSV